MLKSADGGIRTSFAVKAQPAAPPSLPSHRTSFSNAICHWLPHFLIFSNVTFSLPIPQIE